MVRQTALRVLTRFWLASAALYLLVGLPSVVDAQSLPPSEKQKIESLINVVAQANDVKFVRNGSEYTSSNAATFLRRKWEANASEVKSARDFVGKVASFSGTSGKPYLIRFKDGRELKAHDYLLAELKKIESGG